MLALDLKTPGMEFASEMIVLATLNHLKITQVPVVLSPDGRSRPSHLQPWRDGWRHLRYILNNNRGATFLLKELLWLVGGVFRKTFRF